MLVRFWKIQMYFQGTFKIQLEQRTCENSWFKQILHENSFEKEKNPSIRHHFTNLELKKLRRKLRKLLNRAKKWMNPKSWDEVSMLLKESVAKRESWKKFCGVLEIISALDTVKYYTKILVFLNSLWIPKTLMTTRLPGCKDMFGFDHRTKW